MRSLRLLALTTALAATAPTASLANDYITNSPSDWYRFVGPNGSEVQAQITNQTGNWRMWSEFGGFGRTWVYTDAGHDSFWFWNGSTNTLVGDLSGQVGSSQTIDMPPFNQGRATIASRGSVTVPAGTFSDAVEVTFQTSGADAGVLSVWFARGVGVVKYTTQSIAGPREFVLDRAMVGGQALPTGGQPTVSGPAKPPTEHDPMELILWGCNDTYIVRDTYRDGFRALGANGVRSQVIVGSGNTASQLRYEMQQDGVSLNLVEILTAPVDSVWMRDYGPIVMKRPSGDRSIADFDYYPGRPRDDDVPRAYANYRGWTNLPIDLSFEGGNFATDGDGLAICSLGVQWFNDLSVAGIERRFEDAGCDRVVFLRPLIDEGTTHVDMFMRFMSDDAALVSDYPASHRQSTVTDAAASDLRGLGYRVVQADADHRYDEYATYTNSVLANGIALVPQYEDATKNRAALRAYESLGYTAYGVDSRLIIRYSGATHCVSMQIPAGN